MKFFRIDLLTLLISLFILNSCKNQDTVGFTNGTQGNLSGAVVDTATVITNTVPEDSVVTSGITKAPLGVLVDPIFGTTTSVLAGKLNLPDSTAYTRPSGTIIIDSAVLVLKYADGFYGDSLSNFTANVYQLTTRINSSDVYYNNTTAFKPSTLLGTLTFQPRPLDSVKIDTAIAGAKDTVKKVSPQIRIPISKSFLTSALFEAGTTTLGSNTIFNNNVKGLYVNIAQPTGTGGIMMIKGDSINVNIYIRSSVGTVTDTSEVILPVSRNASQISYARSPAVQAALNNKASNSLVYLQGLAGTRAKVSFPYIKKLFDTIGVNNVVINRAELVVTPETNSDIPAYLVPLPKISLYRFDVAHTRVESEDASSVSDVTSLLQFGGYYLYYKPAKSYHFLVTEYVQDLILNRTLDYGTYIAPVDTTNTTSVAIAATAQTAARTVVGGGYSHSQPANNTPYSMRLNVIYTKTKK